MQKTVQAIKLNDKIKTAQKSFSHHCKKTSTLNVDKHTEENKSAISWALCVFLQPLKTTTTRLQGTAISGADGEVCGGGDEGGGWGVGDRQSFPCYNVSVFLSLQLKSDLKNKIKTKATSVRWPEGG